MEAITQQLGDHERRITGLEAGERRQDEQMVALQTTQASESVHRIALGQRIDVAEKRDTRIEDKLDKLLWGFLVIAIGLAIQLAVFVLTIATKGAG